jgi:hypothetical protein
MESLVVTLETAKKLKAAGFPQARIKMEHWWIQNEEGFVSLEVMGLRSGEGDSYFYPRVYENHGWDVYSAPTAQELASRLTWGNHSVQLTLVKRKDGKYAASYAAVDGSASFVEVADTMAEALAALWLKLEESK